MNKHLLLARPDILTLKPYEHAIWDAAYERLHANENPWRADGDLSVAGLNRYPECPPVALVERLSQLYGVKPQQLTVGRNQRVVEVLPARERVKVLLEFLGREQVIEVDLFSLLLPRKPLP